jgi:hypothetical protein
VALNPNRFKPHAMVDWGMTDANAMERRRSRANWTIRRYRLGEEPAVNSCSALSVSERVNVALRLSQEMWAMSGKPRPRYSRKDIPGNIIRKP